MIKRIRLEIPLDIWEDLPSHRIWLKVTENKIEVFEDRDWKVPFKKTENNAILYADVPKELSLIELIGPGGLTPAENISMGWRMDEANPNWRIPGLKKVTIIMEDLVYDVPIVDEKPDSFEWVKFSDRLWLFQKSWAMTVYTFENKTIAALHWHPKLSKQYPKKIRKIQLSKKVKIPCMWEKGGFESKEKGGTATIICQENGAKIKPLFIKKGKGCSCGEHALIPVHKGYIVIDAIYEKRHIDIEIWQIQCIHPEYCEAEMKYMTSLSWNFKREEKRTKIKKEIAEFSYSHWNNPDMAEKYEDAILAAFDKATHYQCRVPHFVRDIT